MKKIINILYIMLLEYFTAQETWENRDLYNIIMCKVFLCFT